MKNFDYGDSKPLFRKWLLKYIKIRLTNHMENSVSGMYSHGCPHYEKGISASFMETVGGLCLMLSEVDGKNPDEGLENNLKRFKKYRFKADHEDLALLHSRSKGIIEKYLAEACGETPEEMKPTLERLYAQAGMAQTIADYPGQRE